MHKYNAIYSNALNNVTVFATERTGKSKANINELTMSIGLQNEMHTFWKHVKAYIWYKTQFYPKITCKCTTTETIKVLLAFWYET